jgi:transposase
LLTLGHAAEYLATSRRYSMQAYDREAEVEAIHILLGLSRSVFEEYAERRSLQRRFEDWLIERAVRL